MEPLSTSFQSIAPTISNSSGVYYIASNSKIQHSSITCAASDCHLLCDVYHGCFDLTIDASQASSLNIQCSSIWSCGLITINKGPSNSASIHCMEANACWNSEFISTQTNQVYFECDGARACSSVILNTNNSNTVTLLCNGSRACSHFNLHPHSSPFVRITATGSSALYGAIITANDTKSLYIACGASHNISACTNNIYRVPSHGQNLNIYCYGTGCFEMGTFITKEDYQYTDMNINGCGMCHSAANCISKIQLDCISNNESLYSTLFEGAECHSSDCKCGDLSSSAIRRFIDDPLDPMCTATVVTAAPIDTTLAAIEPVIVRHKETIFGIGMIFIVIACVVICIVTVMCFIVWCIYGPSKLKRRNQLRNNAKHVDETSLTSLL